MLLLVATRSYSFIQQTSSFVSFSPTLVSSSSMHCVPSMWGGYSLAACGFRPFFPRLRGIRRFFFRLRGVSRIFLRLRGLDEHCGTRLEGIFVAASRYLAIFSTALRLEKRLRCTLFFIFVTLPHGE